MSIFSKMFSAPKSNPIPPRPPITEEESFVQWMVRYDDATLPFRQMVTKKGLDGLVKMLTLEIMRELKENPSSEKLKDRWSLIAEGYRTYADPVIVESGGLASCHPEIRSGIIVLVAKMLILPYFLKYKYGLPLPADAFQIKEL